MKQKRIKPKISIGIKDQPSNSMKSMSNRVTPYLQPVSDGNKRKILVPVLPLPGIIHKNEFMYVKIYETDAWAIYAAQWLAGNGKAYITGYEIFKKRIKKSRMTKINGKIFTFPAKYRYPANEDFGKWAWFMVDIERALALINKWENWKLPEVTRIRIKNLLKEIG